MIKKKKRIIIEGSKAFETHNLSMVLLFFYCSCCCREPLNIAHIFLSVPRHANKIRTSVGFFLLYLYKLFMKKYSRKPMNHQISNDTIGGLPKRKNFINSIIRDDSEEKLWNNQG